MDARNGLRSVAILAIMALCVPAVARNDATSPKSKAGKTEAVELPAVLMHDMGNPANLDLFYGVGSKEDAPDPNLSYVFVKQVLKQTQPKFDVEDSNGVRWRVKLGSEVKAETAATRLVWAMGYFVDEDYYLDKLKVKDLPKLRRGEKYADEDGTVRHVRLERRRDKTVKEVGQWKWFSNPFMRTRELNGLRVMMAVVNNWDLVTKNNSIYEVDGERRYLVSDIGSSLGHTGDYLNGTKGVVTDYADAQFIRKVTPDTVDFVLRGGPFPLSVVMDGMRLVRPGARDAVRNIPRSDAKWMGQKLAQLSENQIRDCFRAAGYSPEEIDGYTKVVQERIAALNAL